MTRTGRSIFLQSALVATALAFATSAVAQQGQDAPAPGTSDAFDRACVDLLHGRTPRGAQATETLRDACGALLNARAEERKAAERRAEQQRQARAAQTQAQAQAQGKQAQPQAGQTAAPVEPGESVLAAFAAAGNELVGNRPRGAMGLRRTGTPFQNTLTTNPVGWFTGVGVNAELLRSFRPQFAWTAGAHYSQANATDTSLYTLGVSGGVDYFLLGQHNEGLRLGPRLDYSFGREATDSAEGTGTRTRLGLAGELGYNFIATNGISGQAAFGVGGRILGDENEELSSAVGGDFGPYVKVNVGYSW
jgi:hypothetical protein